MDFLKRTRRSQPVSAERVIKNLFSKNPEVRTPFDKRAFCLRLFAAWPHIVGEHFGKRCAPVDLTNTYSTLNAPTWRLVLWVNSSAQAQELFFVKHSIKDKVNTFLKTSGSPRLVQGLGFTQNPSHLKGIKDLCAQSRQFLDLTTSEV